MKKLFIFALACFASSCTLTHKVESLPDAKFNQPYSVSVNFTGGLRLYPDSFRATITPEDSGLSVSSVTGKWDNETVISGTPITKQDITVEISYYVRGAVGWFESKDQKKFYQIKIKK